ncbi:MAG TPA: hypothetical protein VFS28_00360 [Gemmatimonadales bacterium]|nr:hypothetical protein [Gemmatimonadales bacterium]
MTRLTRHPSVRALAALLIAVNLAGSPAMVAAYAAGSAMDMSAGPATHGHDRDGRPDHGTTAPGNCCTLCVASCVSAPTFGTVRAPAPLLLDRGVAIDFPLDRPVVRVAHRWSPPPTGPPAAA